MSKYSFDAVVFDLDGVITQTALVHSTAWKKMFDTYLIDREERFEEVHPEFTHAKDYLPYVDGKPRYKGVDDFLKSRNINIPFGDPSDTTDMETVCGLGNRKDVVFNEILKTDGVKVYDSTVALIKELKDNGIHVGVASSSKNCKIVLEAAKLIKLFEVRIDGVVSAEMGLKGKPEADIFTVACDKMGVDYHRAIVVEDAVSGVQAGRKGNFGLVLGIAREHNHHELLLNGADIVVNDLSETSLEGLEKWFREGIELDNWQLQYREYEPKKERTREALTAVGNGYFGTRGTFEEMDANAVNSPGTYIAGIYNRLSSPVGDRMVDNEDFVNCPNWLPINFKIGDGEWFDINKVHLVDFQRKINFRTGIYSKRFVIKDEKGRETLIESRRIASMDNPHLAAIKYSFTPVNYDEVVTFRSALNGAIKNEGVERYKQLNQNHLAPVEQGGEGTSSYLVVKTTQSNIQIAEASKLFVYLDDYDIDSEYEIITSPAKVVTQFELDLSQGSVINIEKIVAIYTSVDKGNPLEAAKKDLEKVKSFKEVFGKSEKRWTEIWNEIDVKVEGDRISQKLLRMHLYHLMVSASMHNAKIDASFTARGLHGEAYRGHIFWDELFILPFYNVHYPDAAKATLLYRYNRLDTARKYAKEYGYEGAMFPWQSGSDGREETQVVHLNPLDGTWGEDYSSLQRHVSLAIAYDVWVYYFTTNDLDFIEKQGAEMFFEICRFWASKCRMNDNGRFSIEKVMGPDEFHEKYPDAKEEDGGLRDNAYTNLMSAWMFKRAEDLLAAMDDKAKKKVIAKIKLTDKELARWKEISEKLNLVISKDGILSQYDGYFNLHELDWNYYRQKYGNIYRLDRILKAEGKSPDEFKVAKQADTLMTFYNLDESEVTKMLKDLGYKVPKDYLKRNLEYYLARTSHGSTLSRVVHAQLANMIGDMKLSWELYFDALTSDYDDIQGGTTAEGIHAGVMAGTILIALNSYCGLNLRSEMVKINPQLPKRWNSVSFGFHFRGNKYSFTVGHKYLKAKVENSDYKPVSIEVNGKKIEFNDEWKEVEL